MDKVRAKHNTSKSFEYSLFGIRFWLLCLFMVIKKKISHQDEELYTFNFVQCFNNTFKHKKSLKKDLRSSTNKPVEPKIPHNKLLTHEE